MPFDSNVKLNRLPNKSCLAHEHTCNITRHTAHANVSWPNHNMQCQWIHFYPFIIEISYALMAFKWECKWNIYVNVNGCNRWRLTGARLWDINCLQLSIHDGVVKKHIPRYWSFLGESTGHTISSTLLYFYSTFPDISSREEKNYEPALVQTMMWRQTDGKPLNEP